MPTFREKLVDSFLNLDHPVWVTDDDFDVWDLADKFKSGLDELLAAKP